MYNDGPLKVPRVPISRDPPHSPIGDLSSRVYISLLFISSIQSRGRTGKASSSLPSVSMCSLTFGSLYFWVLLFLKRNDFSCYTILSVPRFFLRYSRTGGRSSGVDDAARPEVLKRLPLIPSSSVPLVPGCLATRFLFQISGTRGREVR